jgi:tetratricopeptide (TPR) repeat protein
MLQIPAPASSLLAPVAILTLIASCQSPQQEGSTALVPEAVLPEVTQPIKTEATPAPVQDDEAMDRVTRRRQARLSMAQDLVAQAIAEIDQADLDGAALSYSQALQLDPSNASAVEGLRRVQALLGDKFSESIDAFDNAGERILVQRQMARLEASEHARKGDSAMQATDYDGAVEHYRMALAVLAWTPAIAQGNLDRSLLEGRLEVAQKARADAEVNSARLAREAAEAATARAEEEEMTRREMQLEHWYEQANQAFLANKYSDAEKWCQLVLQREPDNKSAQDLFRAARELRHVTTDERNRRHYREQWLKTMDELGMMDVPQIDPLVFDMDRWREVANRRPISANVSTAGDAERSAILSRLDDVRFAPPFDEDPLESVASYLQDLTGVNFHVSARVRDELGEDETTINLSLRTERSVRKVLDLIEETSESLRWTVKDGVVRFIVADELTGGQIQVNYKVHDLINPIPDFPGRDINVSPSGGLFPPDEDLPERETNVLASDLLEDLIRNTIDPESWDLDASNSIRITDTGAMVVNQTPEVQAQIASLLEDLREATGIMVDIQAQFMKVEDNFLEDIGVDFTGLGQPGLGTNGNDMNDFGDPSISSDLTGSPGSDNTVGAFFDEGGDGALRARVEHLYGSQLGTDDFRGSGGVSFQWTFLNDLELEVILRAVQKSERIELVTAPRILVHNAARANLSVLNQVAYVADFDVEIAQAASIADPIVQVIQDGVVLDVRPVVSADRRFINLELRPTIAHLTRPIEQRATTLGSSNSVTIELPEVEIQRVRTSVPIPDGATVMLGGNKISRKQDMQSGVPILNKIPFLSFLFEREGHFVSNEKLLILLKATIIIPRELEPTAAELGRNQ